MTPVDALRLLIAESLYHAGSGHPGGALGMAEMGYTLWTKHLRHAPAYPHWINRDRFVLSNGHTCMLLYALLHLSGYPLTRADLQAARSLHSLTPGHPEYGLTPGIDISTGPLGQGIANAVGFALAERELARQYNEPDFPLIDHMTYAFVGDGCLMEGISHEVCTLAGTHQLGKLIVLYDANHISMEGETSPWFNESLPDRFRSYHWQVIGPIDGHDPDAIDQALCAARAHTEAPSLIICTTIIGWGLPLAGSAKTHGQSLSAEDLSFLYRRLHLSPETEILSPEIYAAYQSSPDHYHTWQQCYEAYTQAYPDKARSFADRMANKATLISAEKAVSEITSPLSTRAATHKILSSIGPQLHRLMGASADVALSTHTLWTGAKIISPTQPGQYLQCGVREFGMAAIMNGFAAYGGGFIPFDSTFLVFSDYLRSAIRMAALMALWRIFIFTHDSIAVGEDGPTHQPIEHLMSLRLIPRLQVLRPCDAQETAACWTLMLNTPGTYALILSRQHLPCLSPALPLIEGARRLRDNHHQIHLVILASGSEVSLACAAYEQLHQRYPGLAVVSLCAMERFLSCDQDLQATIIPPESALVIIEAGRTRGWDPFLRGRRHVRVIGIDHFGISGPPAQVQAHCDLTVDVVMAAVEELYQEAQSSKTP